MAGTQPMPAAVIALPAAAALRCLTLASIDHLLPIYPSLSTAPAAATP